MNKNQNKPRAWVPSRIYNTPLMVTPEAVNVILGSIGALDEPALPVPEVFFTNSSRADGSLSAGGTIAVIPIVGGMAYRCYGWCWRTTYGEIRKAFREALSNPEVDAILFDIDSPGGEIAGVFDLIDEIYQARGQKSIYAMANEDCYSAAYGIASATDKVFLSRTAGVGSIVVIAIHFEQSVWEKNIGDTYTPIFAGARKNDFSIHEPLSKEAHKVIEKHVFKSYDIFVETVARNRDMKPEDVRATEAGIFNGNDAVTAGLADEVLSWDQVIEKITSDFDKQGGISMDLTTIQTNLQTMLAGENAEQVAAMFAGLGYVPQDDQPEVPEDLNTQLAAARQEGAEQAVTEINDILGLCDLAGRPELVVGLIRNGVSKDAAPDAIQKALAETSGDEITSTVGATSEGGKNPLIADAENRPAALKGA